MEPRMLDTSEILATLGILPSCHQMAPYIIATAIGVRMRPIV